MFYVDFNNEFGDGYGTIYLKSDQVTTAGLTDYINYTSKNTKYFEQLNSLWAQSEIKTIDQNNERATSGLADPTEWTEYGDSTTNSNVNYAIGAPTVELYLASYNKSFGTNYKCRISSYGYQYSTDGGNSYANYTNINTISTEKNGMYCNSVHYWLASPSSNKSDGICCVNNGGALSGSVGSGVNMYICPLVSLKSNTTLNFK